MKIIKNKRGKYVLRKFSLGHLGYAYADADDLRYNREIFWWSKMSPAEFDSLEELTKAIENYDYTNPKEEVIKKRVKFGK